VLGALAAAVALPACSSASADAPPCGVPANPWILVAQTVPTATFLPCVGELPTGWTVTAARFEPGSYTAWLDSDRAGLHALELRLTPGCDTKGAVEVPAVDVPPGVRVYEKPIELAPFEADRYLTFAGGCVTYAYRFGAGVPPALALEVQQALDVTARAEVRRALAAFGLVLCGAGAPPCPG
jgi:hypothetical protein